MNGPTSVTVITPWPDAEWATPLRDILTAAEVFPGAPMEVRLSQADLARAYMTREVGGSLRSVLDDPNAYSCLAGLFSALLRLPVTVVPGLSCGRVEVGPNAVLVGVSR